MAQLSRWLELLVEAALGDAHAVAVGLVEGEGERAGDDARREVPGFFMSTD